MRVAIHQPNFVPWMPFFEKARAADMFVILSHCQWTKRGYQNRFRLNGKWHTMSVCGSSREAIRDKKYMSPQEDWARVERRLPRHAKVLSSLRGLVGASLLETNVAIIGRLMQMLGVKTGVLLDWPTKATGTGRLVEICARLGATTYVSGPSGPNYMDLDLFAEADIAVEFTAAEDRRSVLEVLQ